LDVVEVTRCKNCVHWDLHPLNETGVVFSACTANTFTGYQYPAKFTSADHYCADGSPKPIQMKLFVALHESPYDWAWRVSIDEEEPNLALIDNKNPKRPMTKAFHVQNSHSWERRKVALAKTFKDWMVGKKPIVEDVGQVWS
tara:strand:- start:3 stop:428 length:426 start_codon:yes stop_codon:yes gene_type:complete